MGYQIRLPAGAEGKQADAFRKLAGEVGYALNDLERRLSAAETPAKGAVTAQALASGAVTAEALASGAVAEEALGDTVIRCNPNLLDNWYFANPVNQRAVSGTFSTSRGYFIDRWILSAGSVAINSSGIYLASNAAIQQRLEFPIPGSKTVSCLFSDGTMGTGTYSEYSDGNATRGLVTISASGKTIVAVKLELGTRQTLCRREGDAWALNQIPDYGQQLSRCQRFFYKTESRTYLSGYVTGGAKTYRSELPIPVPMRKKPAVTGTIPLLTIRTASGGYSSAFGYGGIAPDSLNIGNNNGATVTLDFTVTTAADTNNSILLFEWYPGIQLSADL